jgi:hypothetical protein
MHEWYKHLKLVNEITYQGIALGGYFVNQIEVRECLLLCGAKYFVFQFAVQKIKINPLMTKRRLLYIKTQSVPRCKHFSCRL